MIKSIENQQHKNIRKEATRKCQKITRLVT